MTKISSNYCGFFFSRTEKGAECILVFSENVRLFLSSSLILQDLVKTKGDLYLGGACNVVL